MALAATLLLGAAAPPPTGIAGGGGGATEDFGCNPATSGAGAGAAGAGAPGTIGCIATLLSTEILMFSVRICTWVGFDVVVTDKTMVVLSRCIIIGDTGGVEGVAICPSDAFLTIDVSNNEAVPREGTAGAGDDDAAAAFVRTICIIEADASCCGARVGGVGWESRASVMESVVCVDGELVGWGATCGDCDIELICMAV